MYLYNIMAFGCCMGVQKDFNEDEKRASIHPIANEIKSVNWTNYHLIKSINHRNAFLIFPSNISNKEPGPCTGAGAGTGTGDSTGIGNITGAPLGTEIGALTGTGTARGRTTGIFTGTGAGTLTGAETGASVENVTVIVGLEFVAGGTVYEVVRPPSIDHDANRFVP
jgi:hypothetical protein